MRWEQTLKGELNAKTNLFLFKSIDRVDYLCEGFLKLKSNYIEKINIETKKTLSCVAALGGTGS